VHVDLGQLVHRIGGARQRDPVVLQVLPGGEVAPALVELARDAGQLVQLAGVEFAIRHGHPQHRCMALDVPAVLQPQRLEVVVGQLTAEVALQLVAELRGAGMHKLAVEIGVGVHR
jgi:hypothetical protein